MDTQQIETLQGSELDLAVYTALYPKNLTKWLWESEDSKGDTIYIEEKKQDWSIFVPCYQDNFYIPPYDWRRVPRFQKRMDYAWLCIEELDKMQYVIQIDKYRSTDYRCVLIKNETRIEGYADTAPIAICRAFLRAKSK